MISDVVQNSLNVPDDIAALSKCTYGNEAIIGGSFKFN